ncbi:MAG: DNA repair protein RecO, partial [Candidatus Magasanikbacteria bacterium]
DFNKMMLVKTVFSWLSVLIRNNEPDNKIFLLIKNWLEFLDSSAGVSAALGYGFLANLVSFLGFAPSLNSCAVCNEKNNLVGFYPAGGGVVCKKCLIIKKQEGAKVYPIRLVDLQAIKWLFSKQWDKVTEQNTEIANRLVFLYVQYHSEKKLVKIAKFD